MSRQMASWNEDFKKAHSRPRSSIWPTHTNAFMGGIDMAIVGKAIKFEQIRLQSSAEQAKTMEDLIASFGIIVFLTDDIQGYHK